MPSRPRLVKAGETLRDQMNERFPKRDTTTDGWIGDEEHQQNPLSDHNPDSDNWVHALDLDEDFGAPGDNKKFADQLIEYAREGLDGGRLKYVVYEDQVASGSVASAFWVWRGSGYGHLSHIHVSFTDRAERDNSIFDLPIFQPPPAALWDGVVPQIENVNKGQAEDIANIAVYRVSARLFDLGFYTGEPPVIYEQRYPERAVVSFQKAQGWEGSGNYGPHTHARLFDL